MYQKRSDGLNAIPFVSLEILTRFARCRVAYFFRFFDPCTAAATRRRRPFKRMKPVASS